MNSGESQVNDRRTSSSLLLDQDVCAKFPSLEGEYKVVHKKGQLLFEIDDWWETGRLPPSGHHCYEYAQIARYASATFCHLFASML